MEQNPFLMNFIKMRKAINANSSDSKPVGGMNSLVNPNLSRQAPSLLPIGSEDKPVRKGDITFKKIVESKVGKTKVVEYLRNHIEELKPLYLD